ncbi:hypothetical protein ACH4F6_39135 [Streptomyces sp. NPDC017936]|uniref:hypothetical protein n=1 Tax=Streptomyces sp. NPDC017936 TaxID=3365016 RepID=UPI003794DBC4
MGEYSRQIAEQETAIREASGRKSDARMAGNAAGARAAQKTIDNALDNINTLKVMEKYRAQD